MKNPFTYILLSLPFFLLLVCMLLPTFDDWTYMTTPYFGDWFSAERVLPNQNYWRPFDALFGSVLGLNYHLFPVLNHVVIVIGHLFSAILVYLIARRLAFSRLSLFITTLFFYLSPSMLGAVLGIDSINQIYSHLWGLLALYLYLTTDGKWYRHGLMALCVLIATWCKENGLAWSVIPPLFAYGLSGRLGKQMSRRQLLHGWMLSMAIVVVYMTLRVAFRYADIADADNEYLQSTLDEKMKDVLTFVGMPWIPVDYVSVVHAPNRNMWIAAATLMLGLPFIGVLLVRGRKVFSRFSFWTLLGCWVICASPHLLTLFSSMHAYAGLSMAALMAGMAADEVRSRKLLKLTFVAWLLVVLFIDYHHWVKSYHSGLTGRKMSLQAVQSTPGAKQRVYILIIDHGETKYSSFCVIPSDAFAWGYSVPHYTGYQWPEEVSDTVISSHEKALCPAKAAEAYARGYDWVWIVEGDSVISYPPQKASPQH